MPELHSKNKIIFYKFHDLGHKKTIVLSNSLGTDHTMWESVMDNLKHRFNVLRYDTQGHGNSSIPENNISIDDLGNDVISLLDAVGIEKAFFCGISMGGLIGQWLGINHPKRFKKIIVANTAAKIGTAESWAARVKQVTEQGMESIIQGTKERWFTAKFVQTHPEAVNAILERFKNNDVQGYAACCAAIGDCDFREKLQDLKVPTLIISGLQDMVTTVADGNDLSGRIPEATHIQLNAAHLSNIGQPEEFAKNIIEFTL